MPTFDTVFGIAYSTLIVSIVITMIIQEELWLRRRAREQEKWLQKMQQR